MRTRKFVVTGASGSVGKMLVPVLLESGADIILVGRTPQTLRNLYPNVRSCGYAELDRKALGYDTLVHLAVLNNNSSARYGEFEAANVELLLETVASAQKAQIKQFINVSTVHALDPSCRSHYAQSKRAAVERLKNISGIRITTLYLPRVYGDVRHSNPKSISSPSIVSRIFFSILSTAKPTLDVSKLASLLNDTHDLPPELIFTDSQQANGSYHFSKRTIDVAISTIFIALFWWVMAGIWLAVKMSSPGPGVFAQKRIGANGRPFTCYKFRTMSIHTPNVATHDASTSLITPIGKVLRRLKLDELPQLINVLRNDMSLIGPRPSLPSQKELIAARQAVNVLELKPGISGLAQINQIDMSNPGRLACWDSKYRALQCLTLDFRIIIFTAFGKGWGDPISRSQALR